MLRKKLGLAIRRRRKALNYSQEDMAELADIHRNYLGRIERGEHNFTIDTLYGIAIALKCRPCELLQEASPDVFGGGGPR